MFQSPSLRGSGRFLRRRRSARPARSKFQSPSLRGSGRFRTGGCRRGARTPSFNPLHCGAVVASPPPHGGGARREKSFNPLHCGAVVASCSGADDRTGPTGFNPLHCGAVVASLRRPLRIGERLMVSIPFIAGQWSLHGERGSASSARSGCFNPLHCGAVVASHLDVSEAMRRREFQSPSLRGSGRFRSAPTSPRPAPMPFQSPSLRGSGRFTPTNSSRYGVGSMFQSPSLRGSGRFAGRARADLDEARVSIPFIAGQWSLPPSPHGGGGPGGKKFQSPSLRGSGRFRRGRARREKMDSMFQSPSLRGSGRFAARIRRRRRGARVSIPFIAGQWSLRSGDRARRSGGARVSIPFIAGQWSLLGPAPVRL